MSLRKTPNLTPARFEAHRRNALKSTGPRTARGKAPSRVNSLRSWGPARFMHDLCLMRLDARPCSMDRGARAQLTPEQSVRPFLAETVDMFREIESAVVREQKDLLVRVASYKSGKDRESRRRPSGAGKRATILVGRIRSYGAKHCNVYDDRSRKVIENVGHELEISLNVIDNEGG
jgi:hypothetical protein